MIFNSILIMKWLKLLWGYFKRFWNFLWFEESLLSYASFIIVSFLLLKLVLFPSALFLLGWKDVVAVLSTSMVHYSEQGFVSWYYANGFNASQVNSWPFQQGLNVGDAVIVVPTSLEELRVGDVIVFTNPITGEEIIHRLIDKTNSTFTTHGDANQGLLSFEVNVPHEYLVGKAVARIPLMGYPRVLMKKILGV